MFLVRQPPVDALAVVLVAALREPLVLLELAEDVEADRAGVLARVAVADEGSLPDGVDLSLGEALRDGTVPLAELHQLLVGHAVRVGLAALLALFDRTLQQPLLLGLTVAHALHHRLHEHLLLLVPHLLLLHGRDQGELSPLVFPGVILSLLSLSLLLVLSVGGLGPELEVALAQVRNLLALLRDYGILLSDFLQF